MNRFAILCQLAFLSISQVPAEANFEKIRRLKQARITSTNEGVSPQVFNAGEVYLYRTSREAGGRLQYFVIGDESDEKCAEFPIAQHNTIVTRKSLTVKWFERTITLVKHDNECSNFLFFKTLFTLEAFDPLVRIVKAFEGREELPIKVGSIMTKQIEKVEVFFAVADNNLPRVMFPRSCVTVIPKKAESVKEISVELGTEPKEIVRILFSNSNDANEFYKLISRRPSDPPSIHDYKSDGAGSGINFMIA